MEPFSYRLYSRFCGPTPDIIPVYVFHSFVEPRLNPPEFWDELEDKNNFARIVGEELLPATIASRQAGGKIALHSPLSTLHSPLILKPSVGTSCGQRIMKLEGMPDEKLLLDYGDDWVLQEAVDQHPSLERLCSTSVNTVRLAVYRSVVDEQPHITGAVLRVGQEGSIVDNASAGGRYVGIDIATGQLQHQVFSSKGCPVHVWNNVNYGQEKITVPSWEDVKQMALKVSSLVPHQHLMALDIAVREDGSPVLLEYNIGGFSSFLYHFTGHTVFGPWTGEVLDYLTL